MGVMIGRLRLAWQVLRGERDSLVGGMMASRLGGANVANANARARASGELLPGIDETARNAASEEDVAMKSLAKRTEEWGWRVRRSSELMGDKQSDELLGLWQAAGRQGEARREAVAPLSKRREWARKVWEATKHQWLDGDDLGQVKAVAAICLAWHEALDVGMSVELADELVSSADRAIWNMEYMNWAASMQSALGKIGEANERQSVDFAHTIYLSISGLLSEPDKDQKPILWHSLLIEFIAKSGMPDVSLGKDAILRARRNLPKSIDNGMMDRMVDWSWREFVAHSLNSSALVNRAKEDYGIDFLGMLRAGWEKEDLKGSVSGSPPSVRERVHSL